MKKILTLFTTALFLLAFSTASYAQSVDGVISALRRGSASELIKHADDAIEIRLPSKSDSYSRSQAAAILQDFFQVNGVKSFEVKFNGNNGGAEFCVGTLQTRTGSYRTTFLMANRNGKQWVREISFQAM
jgi:hypothetical protein